MSKVERGNRLNLGEWSILRTGNSFLWRSTPIARIWGIGGALMSMVAEMVVVVSREQKVSERLTSRWSTQR